MAARLVAVAISSWVFESRRLELAADWVELEEVSAAMPLTFSRLSEIASMLFFWSAAATEISFAVLEVVSIDRLMAPNAEEVCSMERLPVSTFCAMVLIVVTVSSVSFNTDCTSVEIFFAWALLSAESVLTSSATTAKPFPCLPARTASIAALIARMLVWVAMSRMTSTIS